MLCQFNKNDIKLVRKLLERKELNIAASNAFFEFSFSGLQPDELLEFLELDLSNMEEKAFFDDYFNNSLIELNPNDFLDNPYVKLTKDINAKQGPYTLGKITLKSGQTIPYDDISVDSGNFFLETSHIGYFKKEFSYFALMKDDVVWMSTDPNEIITMNPYIQKAHGDILVMGLGLGYYPFMTALKDDVKSITIIEKDPKVIDIFKKYILPKLNINKPFNIIQDDAFSFIKKNDVYKYSYIFMDIWHNAEDGLPLYLRFKSLLKEYKGETGYWLEESLIAMYRRCLLTLIEENLMGYTDKNYQQVENEYDKIINDLYFQTKNIKLISFEEVKEFLSNQSILKILNQA